MNKLSALLLLFLSYVSSAEPFNTDPPALPGLTLEEVEQRHRLVYKDSAKRELPCNGFAVNDLVVYTAGHCLRNASAPILDDGTGLDRLASIPERDLVILGQKTTTIDLHEAPIYDGRPELGDLLTAVVYASDRQQRELLRSFPGQADLTPLGLVTITGPLINAGSATDMLDNSCKLYQLRDTYTIAAPGRIGFSGGPMFVQREGLYYYFGTIVAIEHPGKSLCNKKVMQRNAITFSPVYELFPTKIVRR